MKKIIEGEEVFILDENIIFPKCRTCGKDTRPMLFNLTDTIALLGEEFYLSVYCLGKGSKLDEAILAVCPSCLPPFWSDGNKGKEYLKKPSEEK